MWLKCFYGQKTELFWIHWNNHWNNYLRARILCVLLSIVFIKYTKRFYEILSDGRLSYKKKKITWRDRYYISPLIFLHIYITWLYFFIADVAIYVYLWSCFISNFNYNYNCFRKRRPIFFLRSYKTKIKFVDSIWKKKIITATSVTWFFINFSRWY